MANTNGDLGGAAGFGYVLGQWMANGDVTPENLDYRVQDGEPHVIHQVTDDEAFSKSSQSVSRIVGACATAFKKTEYVVDRITIVLLPADGDDHPGALCYNIRGAWAQEFHDDELTQDELLDRIAETQELVEDVDELGLAL